MGLTLFFSAVLEFHPDEKNDGTTPPHLTPQPHLFLPYLSSTNPHKQTRVLKHTDRPTASLKPDAEDCVLA